MNKLTKILVCLLIALVFVMLSETRGNPESIYVDEDADLCWDGFEKSNLETVGPAYEPIIQSVYLSDYKLIDGGEVTVTVVAQSNAPVNWINRQLWGPNGNIYGGGQGISFTNVGTELWELQWTDTFSEWNPSGNYSYRGISVENEEQLQSDEWDPVNLTVTNTKIAYEPIIQSVYLSDYKLIDGGEVTVTVVAQSNAPVNWINRQLWGPNGNIYGGGQSITFTNVGTELWELQWTDTFSEEDSIGNYTYRGISVENEGQLQSDEWDPINFTLKKLSISFVKNEAEDTITVVATEAGLDWSNFLIQCSNGTHATSINMTGNVEAGDKIYVIDSGLTNTVTVNLTWIPTSTSLGEYILTIAKPIYTLSTSVLPIGGGSLLLSPPGGTYYEGIMVTATATPFSGYHFDHWSGDANGTISSLEIVITENITITAHFIEKEDNGGIPGFELLFAIGAIMVILLIRKKRSH